MNPLDFILHIDEHLRTLIAQLGDTTYILLFAIVFAETGLVVMPFLPGDSLLFAVGALTGGGLLNLYIVLPVLIAAAIIGDSVNYAVGRHFGKRAFSKENARLFNPSSIAKTQRFYEKHGGKTIILARFLPIIRTFAPFVAGIGHMEYRLFFAYNVAGAVLWVVSLTLLGHFFGSIPFIKENFEYAIIVIILVSVLPAVYEFIKHKADDRRAPELDFDKHEGKN